MAGIWKKLKKDKNVWVVRPFGRIGTITDGNIEIGSLEKSEEGIIARVNSSGEEYLLTWAELYEDLKAQVGK